MFDHFKQIFDMETAKVLVAGIGGLSATLVFVDILFKVIIGGLTIWYLVRKIRKKD